MNGRTEGQDDSFDLGESSVVVHKGAPGRSFGRIAGATVLVGLGVFVGIIDNIWKISHDLFLEWTGLEVVWGKISVGGALVAVGYAMYDYRWPFGPRPGVRPKPGQKGFERDAHGPEDY